MSFVSCCVVAARTIDSPSWTLVEECIGKLSEMRHCTLLLSGLDGQMAMEYIEDKGYYISAFGKNEIEEWLVVDERLPDVKLKVDVSGHECEVPRQLVVPLDVALNVAKGFFCNGERASNYKWKRSIDLM